MTGLKLNKVDISTSNLDTSKTNTNITSTDSQQTPFVQFQIDSTAEKLLFSESNASFDFTNSGYSDSYSDNIFQIVDESFALMDDTEKYIDENGNYIVPTEPDGALTAREFMVGYLKINGQATRDINASGDEEFYMNDEELAQVAVESRILHDYFDMNGDMYLSKEEMADFYAYLDFAGDGAQDGVITANAHEILYQDVMGLYEEQWEQVKVQNGTQDNPVTYEEAMRERFLEDIKQPDTQETYDIGWLYDWFVSHGIED